MDIWEMISPALETALVTILTLAISAGSFYVRQWLIARIGQERLHMSTSIARAAVMAAEQEASKYGWDGNVKKDYAINFVQQWLDANGIQLDADRIAELIEAAVYDEMRDWLPPAAN